MNAIATSGREFAMNEPAGESKRRINGTAGMT